MPVPAMISSLPAAVVHASASYLEKEGIRLSGVLWYYGVCLIIVGISALAYTGLWRWWSKIPFMVPLGVGWLAAGQIIANTALLVDGPLGYAFLIGGTVVSFFGIYGMGFMPRPFLPRWYRLDWGIDPSRVVPSAGRRLKLIPRESRKVDLAERGRSIASPAAAEAGSPRGGAPIETCEVPGGGTFLGAFIGGAVTGDRALALGRAVARDSPAAHVEAFAP
ncbi:hypothetical protein [Clavibacter sp. VKM Ac-2872]|uniref:hypothetical protein n=1 Tax=Clavibacter sp. VKM Ac-2872 TaxID=2783812 RepID=UPI00188DB084|nr:hypothetical protein [Clavibacter sp. VKM Ac-2872]MBF4624838.1 hypothetical protein [Clavibacter sp. VKM Ac-2872]